MKRFRHYKKDRAIVLSCFGSVIEQKKYFELKEYIEEAFSDVDVFISFSSRMVLKMLAKKGEEYKNLVQVLADVDMLGYKKIAVASVNLFPTDEHDTAQEIVDGFNSFSMANISLSKAILTKSKDTTDFLIELNDKVSKDETINLFITHGTPELKRGGVASITYTENLLKEINENNFVCSLEGSFPFYAIKNSLIKKWKKMGIKKVQLIPMLLVSGNHFIKDMIEIRDELREDFLSVDLVNSLSESSNFNLIELPMTKKILKKSIKETIAKMV